MKKIYILFVLLLTTSCGKFLEESSQDLMIPRSVKDYSEFIFGEGFNNSKIIHPYLEMMTDDVTEFRTKARRPLANDSRVPYWSYYTWQQYPEIGKNNELTIDEAWGEYYHKILISNIIIDKLPSMIGDDKERNALAGESYFLRAWSYFMLANLYGKPYNVSSAATDYCVPINEEIGVEDKMVSRSSVEVIYARILEDVNQSIAYFKQSEQTETLFRPNLASTYLFASRVYLYMNQYDKVINYADSVELVSNAQLADLNLLGLNPGNGGTSINFLHKKNPELLYSYGKSSGDIYLSDYRYTGAFCASDELINLYVAGKDLRAKQYYKYSYTKDGVYEYHVYTPMKWHSGSKSVYSNIFRLSEVYLNRAEAYAELGRVAESQRDINALRVKRFITGYDSQLILSGKDDAVKKVREERRREFAFEEFRWFDLRRYGKPALSHRYSASETVFDDHKIMEGSDAYILPIPKSESLINLVIEQVDRPETLIK